MKVFFSDICASKCKHLTSDTNYYIIFDFESRTNLMCRKKHLFLLVKTLSQNSPQLFKPIKYLLSYLLHSEETYFVDLLNST